jgi:hypothetical protein
VKVPAVIPAAAMATFVGVYALAPGPQGAAVVPTEAPVVAAAPEPSVYYSRCAEARAAGVAPLHRGEPGYREGLDCDLDGVACEPYRVF